MADVKADGLAAIDAAVSAVANSPSPPAAEKAPVEKNPFDYDPEMDGILDDAPAAPKAEAKPEPKVEEKKPVETPKAEAKAEPAKPAHNPDIVELALDLGASQAWIDTQSPAELKAAVRYEMQARRAAESAPKKEEPAKPEAIEFEFGGQKRAVKLEDLDENVAALLQHFHSQNKALTEKFEQQERSSKQARASAVWDSVDEAFGTLDAGLFGEGTRETLDPKSVEFERRKLLIDAAKIELTDTPAQIKRKIAAKAALFGAAPAKVAEAPKVERETPPKDPETGRFISVDDALKSAKEEQRWASNGQSKPTNRTAPELPPGTKRAEKTVAAILKRAYGSVESDS